MELRRFPPTSRQLLLLSFQLSNLTLPIGLQEFVDESSHIKWCPTFFRSRWKRILQFNWWLSTLPKGWRGRDGFVRAHLWDRPIGSLSEGVGEWKRTYDLWFLKTIGVTYISTLPTTWLQWLYGYKLYSKLTKTPGPSNCGVSCPKLTLDPNQRFSAINRLFVWWIIQLSPIPKQISPVDVLNHM